MNTASKARTLFVRDFCTPDPHAVAKGTSVRQCARIMHDSHVGSLVVIDPANQRPVGMLTDRDIAIQCVGLDQDADKLVAEDLAGAPVVAIHEDESLASAIARMRECGVHRLPVINQAGALVGILSATDAMRTLIGQLDALAQAGSAARFHEWQKAQCAA